VSGRYSAGYEEGSRGRCENSQLGSQGALASVRVNGTRGSEAVVFSSKEEKDNIV
jgi:hypothetical protein